MCTTSNTVAENLCIRAAANMLALLSLLHTAPFAIPSQTNCTNNAGVHGPCGPAFQLCGQPYVVTRPIMPRFHLVDRSCPINDPSGPIYDPRHGIYHVFYQDHMAIGPAGSSKFGPVWGHFASRDLVEWRHLDVALWNDESFDATAIFTGSATVVNGSVRLIYSAVCPRGGPDCPNPTCKNVHDCKTKNLGMAVPASPDDPWLTNWTKHQIVFGATRDPSTAWPVQHHPAGTEWRLTTFGGTIYNSWDFEHWTASGVLFEAAECPSLFPLPRDISNSSGRLPTHVRKFSSSQYPWQEQKQRGDYFQVGDYVARAPNTTGTWRPSPGFEPAFVTTLMDAGPLYASKDFRTADGRRVIYGWITAGGCAERSVGSVR